MNDWLVVVALWDALLWLLGATLVGALLAWLWARARRPAPAPAAPPSTPAEAAPSVPLDALPDGALLLGVDGTGAVPSVELNAEARALWTAGGLGETLPPAWETLAREAQQAGAARAATLDTPSGLKLRARAVPLDGERVLLSLEDFTTRRQQQEFYRTFISNVSHELKTPLTVIRGHITAMDSADDAQFAASQRIIVDETTRLTQLVDNLLLLSRLEMQGVALEVQPVNLAALAEDAILQLSDAADRRQVQLGLQAPPGLPRLMGDRARLKQVLINLLDNAVKYTDDGGSVRVRLAHDAAAGDLVVEVSDTGEGIPAEDLPYIFDTMYRVERLRRRSVQGSGLGLSIVKRIVEQHGGQIGVVSQVGHGTTFTVRLPVSRAQTA